MADKTSNKLILTLGFIFILLFGGLGYGGFILYEKINKINNLNKTINNTNNSNKKEDITPDIKKNVIGFVKDTEELVLNLSSSKNKRNYLKIKINFELRTQDDEEIFNQYQAVIFDTVLSITSSKTRQDLMSIGGKESLKEELKEELNLKLPSKIIKNIYFRKFVIQ